ncbi:MAG: hypothetical protein J0I06_21570 [Planctomycetes bacterium]|nr:hypothetical protein [Planctomycetota bacterium]
MAHPPEQRYTHCTGSRREVLGQNEHSTSNSAPADERSDVGVEVVEAHGTDAVGKSLAGSRGVIAPFVRTDTLALAVAANTREPGRRGAILEQ